MLGSFKILAGDFGVKKEGFFQLGKLIMPKGFIFKEHIKINMIKTLEIATEENVKKLAGAIGWGGSRRASAGAAWLLGGGAGRWK